MKMCHLWHERDISHSSAERIILPDATIGLNYMLNRFGNIIKNLTVFPENMKRNMDRTFGLIYSQRVLLALLIKVSPVKSPMILYSQKQWRHGKSRFHSAV